jgi:hypothetical protein
MASDPSTGTLRSHRNPTLFATLWVLASIALIEIILAAIALAPRVASGMRAGATAAMPPSSQLAAQPGTDPSLQQVTSLPTETPKAPQALNDQSSNLPLGHPPSDSTLSGGPPLQIVNARLLGTSDGSKKLQISIKSNTRETIDVPQVKVQVYFYDQDNGEIVPSKAQVTSTWLSPPVDWKKGEPELLEVQYLPDTSSTDVNFAGYLVAIYYKGDLQDCRAEPLRLKKLFEPKYFIGTDE